MSGKDRGGNAAPAAVAVAKLEAALRTSRRLVVWPAIRTASGRLRPPSSKSAVKRVKRAIAEARPNGKLMRSAMVARKMAGTIFQHAIATSKKRSENGAAKNSFPLVSGEASAKHEARQPWKVQIEITEDRSKDRNDKYAECDENDKGNAGDEQRISKGEPPLAMELVGAAELSRSRNTRPGSRATRWRC